MALDLGDRIARLTLHEGALSAELARAIVDVPAITLGTAEVSAMTLSVDDPELDLLGSGIFAKRARFGFRDLAFELNALELADGGGVARLNLEALSAGAQQMRRTKGSLVRHGVSPTAFMEARAKAAELAFVGEPSHTRHTVARRKKDHESDWDVGQRLASELGFVAFESAGTFFFGRPKWLLDRGVDVVVRYPRPQAPGELAPLGVPSCRRSEAGKRPVEVNVMLPYELGGHLRPGMVLDLRGVPTFAGSYLVVNVSFNLGDTGGVAVTAVTPVDPIPQPPTRSHAEGVIDPTLPPGVSIPVPGSGERGSSKRKLSSSGWAWPAVGPITGKFHEWRGDHWHEGIDIADTRGTRATASKAGTVVFAGYNDGYGNMVELDHGGGWRSRYGHLLKFAVSVGRRHAGEQASVLVDQGQVIGYIDSTGHSTGDHLHFEILYRGVPLDPLKYLPKGNPWAKKPLPPGA